MDDSVGQQRDGIAVARWRVGDLSVDRAERRVHRGMEELVLAKVTFDFLLALIERAPAVVTTDELMDAVWAGQVVGPETVSQRARLLRQALGDDAKTPTYFEAVRGIGYRLRASAEPLTERRQAARGLSPPVAQSQTSWLRVGVLFALIAVAAFLGIERISPGLGPASARSIAVMPFLSLGADDDNALLSHGVPDSILHRLTAVDELVVISRTSSFALADTGLSATELGRELGAAYLLEGSVQRADDRIRVVAQLIDAAHGSHVWSIERVADARDIFVLQDQLVADIANALEVTLDPVANEQMRNEGTDNLEAWLAFQRGERERSINTIPSLQLAEQHYRAAIELDGNFARAWLGLAHAYDVLTRRRRHEIVWGSQRVIEYAGRARAIAPTSGNALIYLAYGIELRLLAEEASPLQIHEAVEPLVAEARRLSPSSATVLYAAALLECPQRIGDTACFGRQVDLLNQAIRLDPEAQSLRVELGWVYAVVGRIDDARATLIEALRRNPATGEALAGLARLTWGPQPAWPTTIACLEETLVLDPTNERQRLNLGLAYVDLGLTAEAAAVLAEPGARKDYLALRGPFIDYAVIVRDDLNAPVPERGDFPDLWGSYATLFFDDLLRRAIRAGTLAEFESYLVTTKARWHRRRPDVPGGTIVGRSEAFAAIALVQVYRETDRPAEALALLQEVLAFFERSAKQSPGTTNRDFVGHALALSLAGRYDDAMARLARVPESYLRGAWYLPRYLAFEPLLDRGDFRSISAEVERKIGEFREQVLAKELPRCGPASPRMVAVTP